MLLLSRRFFMKHNFKLSLLLTINLSICESLSAAGDSDNLLFSNPFYGNSEAVGAVVENLNIPNGSLLISGSNGFIGNTIRAASCVNDIQNPL